MTKKDAAEKIAKLMKLANGSSNVHEAATAKAQADKLVAEYGLTKADLVSGEMAAAFDDLVDSLQKAVTRHPVVSAGLFNHSDIIADVLRQIKRLGDVDKSTKLRQIATIVRTASFIAGDTPLIAEVKAIFDSTLKNHNLSI